VPEVIKMNQYVTGGFIKALREAKHLTQTELAERLCVSDKAVSKWETGRGYPDITLLEPLAAALGTSLTELLAGETVQNRNTAANMLRGQFYVCPVCGNVVYGTGDAVISCHGIRLLPETAEAADTAHSCTVEKVDGEYYAAVDHPMDKTHYISFMAAVSSDRVQLVKLYPEGDAAARFSISGVTRIYYYCNKDGLYSVKP